MSCGGEFDELSNNPLLLNSNSNGSNCSSGGSLTMLQQHQLQQSIVFGSQLVKKNSSTPYTDATQVSAAYIVFIALAEKKYCVCVCVCVGKFGDIHLHMHLSFRDISCYIGVRVILWDYVSSNLCEIWVEKDNKYQIKKHFGYYVSINPGRFSYFK